MWNSYIVERERIEAFLLLTFRLCLSQIWSITVSFCSISRWFPTGNGTEQRGHFRHFLFSKIHGTWALKLTTTIILELRHNSCELMIITESEWQWQRMAFLIELKMCFFSEEENIANELMRNVKLEAYFSRRFANWNIAKKKQTANVFDNGNAKRKNYIMCAIF